MTPTDDEDLDSAAQFQGVRDLFRSARAQGFDEEPSPRIDAILMAAARQHAPERVGTFERLRRWMAVSLLRPSIVGATMLAVIGGSVGVLYLRDGGRLPEPVTGQSVGTAGPTLTPTAPERPLDLPMHEAALGSGVGDLTMNTENTEALEERFRDLQEKETRPGIQDPQPKPRGGGGARVGGSGGGGGGGDIVAGGGEGSGAGRGGGEAGAGTDVLHYRPDGRDTTTIVTTGPGSGNDVGGTAGVVTNMETTGTDKTPAPPPDTGTDIGNDDEYAPVTIGGSTTSTDRAVTEKAEKAKKAAANRSQAENLLRQARTAARKKDCATVKVMAKRARQLDAAYYKDSFVRDATVKDCL